MYHYRLSEKLSTNGHSMFTVQYPSRGTLSLSGDLVSVCDSLRERFFIHSRARTRLGRSARGEEERPERRPARIGSGPKRGSEGSAFRHKMLGLVGPASVRGKGGAIPQRHNVRGTHAVEILLGLLPPALHGGRTPKESGAYSRLENRARTRPPMTRQRTAVYRRLRKP